MARLQILELPEGTGDERPPFVLVVDQCEGLPLELVETVEGAWRREGERIGARGVLIFMETVEIPANEVSAEFREGLQESVAELYESARRSLSESETLGHKLLQRAENAEGRSQAMEVQRDRAARRAEQAEAGRVAADNVLRAVCEVFGGPHQDPVVKARETLARAEAAEAKLTEFGKQAAERMDAVTDALGFDRLRDWDEITAAIKRQRRSDAEGGHWFGEPGFVDPLRCARCRMFHTDWVRRGTRCDAVRAENGGE